MIEVEKNKASILGLYTGCLLDLLTERRREQGLETCFYINGQGRKFDYLFSFAKHVDKVIVDNFNARSICSYIANGGGKANLVLVMNCKGDFIASDVGSDKGSNVGMVIMSNVEGQETCFGTGGYGAKAGIVLLVNNKGNDMGGNVATNEGEVELLIAVNNKMNKCLASPGITRGKVGQIVAAYNETNLLCLGGNVNVAENGLIFLDHNNGETLGRVIGANRGYIELAVVANNTGADISEYNGVGHGRLRKLVIHNSGGYTGLNQMREVNINNILTGEQAEKEYHRIRKRYCATKMIDLASSIEEQSSYQEIIRIAEQIKSIHKKVRPKIRKLMKK